MTLLTMNEGLDIILNVLKDYLGLKAHTIKSKYGYKYIDIVDSDGYVLFTPIREMKNNFSSKPIVKTTFLTEEQFKELLDKEINSSFNYEQKKLLNDRY